MIPANTESKERVRTRTGMWSPDTGRHGGGVGDRGSKRAEQEMKRLSLLQLPPSGVGIGEGKAYEGQVGEWIWHS